MVDFVDIAAAPWPVLPQPKLIGNDQYVPPYYLQNQMAVPQDPVKTTVVAGVQSYAPASRSEASKAIQSVSLQCALLWPYHAAQEGYVLPWAAAGIVAAVAAPLIFPDAALGGYVLSGYGVGAVAYYGEASMAQMRAAQAQQPKFITKTDATPALNQPVTNPDPVSASAPLSLSEQIQGLQSGV